MDDTAPNRRRRDAEVLNPLPTGHMDRDGPARIRAMRTSRSKGISVTLDKGRGSETGIVQVRLPFI